MIYSYKGILYSHVNKYNITHDDMEKKQRCLILGEKSHPKMHTVWVHLNISKIYSLNFMLLRNTTKYMIET